MVKFVIEAETLSWATIKTLKKLLKLSTKTDFCIPETMENLQKMGFCSSQAEPKS